MQGCARSSIHGAKAKEETQRQGKHLSNLTLYSAIHSLWWWTWVIITTSYRRAIALRTFFTVLLDCGSLGSVLAWLPGWLDIERVLLQYCTTGTSWRIMLVYSINSPTT